MFRRGLSAIILMLCSSNLHGAITFEVAFTAQALNDLSAAEQSLFTDGVNFWDNIIDGHQDGVSRTWVLTVSTFSQAASGGGVLLGSAGPSALAFSGVVPGSGLGAGAEFGSDTDRFIISTAGSANFNVHPDAGGLQAATIRHEIGHALGIGTLWEDNEVYNDGDAGSGNRTLAGGTPGQYTGANALAFYQLEFDPEATFIPIERDGGPGTANGHWNEVLDNFGIENAPGFDGDPGDGEAAPVVLFGENAGQSQDDELMTGVLSGSAFISETTKASLLDIGFTLETPPVPEPRLIALLSLSALGLLRRRR